MTELKNVLSSLKNTAKGKLSYDSDWYDEGKVQDVIDLCTSPPRLSFRLAPRPEVIDLCTPPSLSARLGPQSCEDPQSETDQKTSPVRRVSFRDEYPSPIALGGQLLPTRQVSPPIPDVRPAHQVSPPKKVTVSPSHQVSPPKKFTVSPTHQVAMSLNISSVEKMLQHKEKEWNVKYEELMQVRKQMYIDYSSRLDSLSQLLMERVYIQQEHSVHQLTEHSQRQQILWHEDLRNRQLQLRDVHTEHAKRLSNQMQEAQEKELEEENRRKKAQADAQQRLQQLGSCRTELLSYRTQVTTSLSTCRYPQYLAQDLLKTPEVIEQLIKKVNYVMQIGERVDPTQEEVNKIKDMITKVKGALDFINSQIEAVHKKGDEDLARQQKKAAAAAAPPPAATPAVATPPPAAVPQGPAQPGPPPAATSSMAPPADSSTLPGVLANSVSADTLTEYESLQNKLVAVSQQIQPLVTDPTLKKLKFDLQKALNTPVNAISPTSGSHVRDKLHKILSLLMGQTVEVSNKNVSCTAHPAGKLFVIDLFAQKIVKQGDEQVSSNHESAFAIAAVTVGVWCALPEITDLLLGYFHTRCPYTAPYYLPKKESQSSEEYYTSLGYIYVNGEREKQDKFLRRMSGLVRLFAAIMVSPPPPGTTNPHPHGTKYAWQWLTRILNLTPRPDITATILHDFLQVAGSALYAAYGKQFEKLLATLTAEYLPLIQQVTQPGAGGPVTRLQTFLEHAHQSRRIAPPAGVLQHHFWRT